MELVALDLEGTGAQDREHEAILEIAIVPILAARPDTANAYSTLINPGRPVPRRPWISPGLTDSVLAGAPHPSELALPLSQRLDGKVVVGHNVGVDWRLLHRHYPDVNPAGLIDTLKLARQLGIKRENSLTALISHYELTSEINRLVPEGRPHRALWDAVGAALLLERLQRHSPPGSLEMTALFAPASEAPETLF